MSKPVFKTTKKGSYEDYTLEFEEGEIIFKEGDIGYEMYVIQEGEVEIFNTIDGQEHRLVTLEKGDFFGEMSLLEDLPRTASARALTKCKLIKIDSTTFDQMIKHNPEIAVRMMRKFSRRLRKMDKALRELLEHQGKPSKDIHLQQLEKSQVFHLRGKERLVHLETDMEFHLSAKPVTLIGRKDPVTGIIPDIDLSPVDVKRSISRQHAVIYRKPDGKFFLEEKIGAMNGTFIKNVRIQTGVPVEIKDGDEIAFGLVKLIFRT